MDARWNISHTLRLKESNHESFSGFWYIVDVSHYNNLKDKFLQ